MSNSAVLKYAKSPQQQFLKRLKTCWKIKKLEKKVLILITNNFFNF